MRTAPPRPAPVTWLGCAGLILAALSLVRLVLSLSLPPLPLTVPPAYLSITGAVGGGLGLAVGAGLIAGRRWAYRAAAFFAPALVVWYWADRLLLVRTDFAQRTWPMAALGSGILLGLVTYALTRPSTRRYFGRPKDDDAPQPPTTA